MIVHLLHGIHTSRPSVVQSLIPFIHEIGLVVRYPDYGFELALETRRVNPAIVGAMLPYIEEGDVIVGHSNGCALAHDLVVAGAPVAGLVLINGALDERVVFPPIYPSWAHVYFNEGDTITEIAEIADRLGLVDTHWGEMGHIGYRGTDARVTNFDCAHTKDMPVVSGHGDIFSPDKIRLWGHFIADRITAAMR